MAASSDQHENGASDTSSELGRLVAETLLKSPFLAMHPTLVPPTAALAAATIIGFGLSTQVVGTFFGALQGAMDVANRFAAEHGGAAPGAASDTAAAKSDANGAMPEADGAATGAPASRPNGAAGGGFHQQAAAANNAALASENTASVVHERRRGGKASAVGAERSVAPASPTKVKRTVRKAIKANDLKRISGIGPKLEQLLNGLGIRAVEQIAGWTDDDVTRIDAALGVDGRIARDGWVAQAKKLAA